MTQRYILAGLMGWFSAMVIGVAQEQPTLTAPKLAAPPKIDGDLSDPCWQQAARVGNFYLYDKLEPATVQTEAWIGYDDNALYVAFRCQEPVMDKLVAEKRPEDGPVSRDDCVELFLSAGSDGKTYFHFLVNPLNARLDQWNRASPKEMVNTWDADWQTATRKEKSAWTVEMAIPWYNLGWDAGTEKWRINFCRGKRTPPAEFSSWAFVKSNFHDTSKFGILTAPAKDLAAFKGLTIYDVAVPNYTVETDGYAYIVKGVLKNGRNAPRQLIVEAEDRPFNASGARAKANLDLPASGTVPFEFKLGIPTLGDRRVSVRLMDAAAPDQVLYMASRGPEIFPQLMKAYLDRNYYSFEKDLQAIAILNIPKSAAKFTAKLEIKPKNEKPIVEQAAVTDPARVVIQLPTKKVPLGTHPATFTILDAKNNVVAKEDLVLRREKPASPPVREVKTDRDRMIALVDGKPFFPIGIYGVPPDKMKVLKEAGFNCTVFWGGQGGMSFLDKKTPEERRAAFRQYLDAAQAAELLVIEWPPNYASDSLSYADPKLPEKMDRFLKERLPEVIDAQKDHPALLAYYSLDEPGGDAYLRGAVAEESRITTEHDPYHPNYVLFCVAISEWPESIDIAGLDFYPRFGQDRVYICIKGAWSAVKSARRLRVPTWHVPLCETSSATVRGGITGAEQRAQLYLALIGGVNGIVYWVWPPRYADNWRELQKLAKEVNAMYPALTTAIPDQATVFEPREMEDTVQAAARVTEDGKTYLLTCNASPIPCQATFKLAGNLKGPAEVLFENRKVKIKDGVITDKFDSYGTHVYVCDGVWPAGGTITVAVTLDKQEQKTEAPAQGLDKAQENLIVDGGMEGENSWQGTLSAKTSHEGKKCAIIERPADQGMANCTGWEVRLEPRTRYMFGCYGRAEMAGGAEAGLYLQGPYPQGEYVRNVTTIKFRDRAPAWERYIVSFTTRDEPLTVRPTLYFGNGRGTAWFDDVFLVKSSEAAESLNLLLNSSFEQDMLPGWPAKWGSWVNMEGAIGGPNAAWGPDATTAYHGKRSMCLRQTEWTTNTYRYGAALDVSQSRLRYEGEQPYTFSAYLKAAQTNTPIWLWINWESPKPCRVDTEWKRYTFTVTPKVSSEQGFVRVSMQGTGTLWVDAAQFERGTNATAFVATGE